MIGVGDADVDSEALGEVVVDEVGVGVCVDDAEGDGEGEVSVSSKNSIATACVLKCVENHT